MSKIDPERKVSVISTVGGGTGIYLPEQSFKRRWEKKGAKKEIPFKILEEGMYDYGFEQLFKDGTLYIEDMEVKIALGLEPEGAKEPESIIVLTDIQRKRLLTIAPMKEFTETLNKLSFDQINELAKFAVKNELVDLNRIQQIKDKCGIDVLEAIRINRADKEA